MKTCVAAACGIFILLASCSGSGEFKPSFNQPLQPVMQPGFVYVDQVAPLVKTNLKYAGYDNFVGRPLDGYHGRRAILRQARQSFLVTDHSKLGRPAPARIASLSEIDTVFIDQPLPEDLTQRCAEWGTTVQVCPAVSDYGNGTAQN